MTEPQRVPAPAPAPTAVPATAAAPATAPRAAAPLPGRLFSLGAQAQLAVGSVDDPQEREADARARDVVTRLGGRPGAPHVHRSSAPTAAGGPLDPGTARDLERQRGRGRPLPDVVRRGMEGAFDADFGAVRIHEGDTARTLNESIAARAFTLGQDVFFRDGLPDTTSASGQELLAHELTHTLQQSGGPIRRDEESAKALTDLATPKSFEGPDVPLQKSIVDRLEKATPEVQQSVQQKKQKLEDELKELNQLGAEKLKLVSEEEQEKRSVRVRQLYEELRQFPELSSNDLYLGSVVLEKLPESGKDDGLLFQTAELVQTDSSYGPRQQGLILSQGAGVDKDIVKVTLATMIEAGQLDYLRKSGFVGMGWKIIVEVHYVRDRTGNTSGLHKDTLGQTLFVNLNYLNSKAMPGPEYLLNPPPVETHEEHNRQHLPEGFNKDLSEVRKRLPPPTSIDTAPEIMPYGVVSFVDELIHHATPVVGHRRVDVGELKEYLASEPPWAQDFQAATTAYSECDRTPSSTGFFSFLSSTKKSDLPAFETLFTPKSKETSASTWRALLDILDAKSDVERPQLQKAGLTMKQIDTLLSQYGPNSYTSVSIPGKSRMDGKSTRVPLREDEEDDRRLPLKRQLSQLALDKQLPTMPKKGYWDKEEPKRAFFRTWVRAVRTG